MDINKIYNEDCLLTMDRMPDKFIDLVVTSPPYDNLRDYKGYNFDFENIAKQLFRVIKDGGVVVWVVGDQVINNSETGTSFRQALYFKDIGFNLHDTMIYEKNGVPYPSNDKSTRYTQIFEYMFVLSKGIPKTHNLIKDKVNRWGGISTFGHNTKRQKDGKLRNEPPPNVKLIGYRNNIWRMRTGYGHSSNDDIAYKHPAIFPEKLAGDHIITWSNKGDLVYDPFMGSGTTAKMAFILERNYIGSEISKDYCNIAEKRIELHKNNLFNL